MKKILKSQSGTIPVIEAVILILILGVGAAIVYGSRQIKITNPAPISQPNTTKSTAKEATEVTFKEACSQLTFKHPADWVERLSDPSPIITCQKVTVTTPSGNLLTWAPSIYGDGPGCDFSFNPGGVNECPTITTIKSEKLPALGKRPEVFLVEQVVCSDANKCEGRIALIQPEAGKAIKVGSEKVYSVANFGSSAFFMTEGKQTAATNPPMPILNFTDTQARQWLASDDVAKAELAMQTLQ